jgi:FkbM family methyltransferase
MKQVIRSVYKKLPYKKPFFQLLKNYVKPSENVYKHLHFEDDFLVQVDESHSFLIRHYGFELENLLFWKGLRKGWEKTSISLWTKLVKNSDVIFDIGANTGVYSLIAKSLNPQSRVYAFEPVRRVFEKLEYNNRLNNYDIVCFDSAVSNADGTATIYDTVSEHVYSVTVNKNLNAQDIEVVPTEIKVRRLDSLIEEMKIEKIDLIKIDVETHEPEVLEGFGKYLEKFKPTMLIEVLNDEVGEKIERLIEGKNYLYFNLDEKSDSIKKVERITKSDFYNYLICSPEIAKEIKLVG